VRGETLVRGLSGAERRALAAIRALWEDVRWSLLRRSYDVVVLWDVVMFMDLRRVHGGSPLAAAIKELDALVEAAGKYLLFSIHPCRRSVLDGRESRAALRYLDEHPRLRPVGKRYLNRIYAKAA